MILWLRDAIYNQSFCESSLDRLSFGFRKDNNDADYYAQNGNLGCSLVLGVMTACRPHSTSPSAQTLTIYQAAPTINPLDLGTPGNSPGDAYYFSAPLYSSPGGRMIGEVFGSKTLIKPATDAKLNVEQRATSLIFTFGNREDQIVVMGLPDYPGNAAEFNAGQSIARAILGGTGRYMGVRGELTSARNTDGSYKQVFTLLR